MIRKEKGEYVAECNLCGEEVAGGIISDFRKFVDHIKDLDWTVKRDDDEEQTWVHFCPLCQEDD